MKISACRRKRIKQLQKRVSISLLLGMIGVIILFVLIPNNSTASTTKSTEQKIYKSILIETGDTLFSIANTFIDDHYESNQEYISEILNINSLSSDLIQAGNYIIVPCYIEVVPDYLSYNE